MSILITGGCGFIGSHFIERLLNQAPKYNKIVNLDRLDYCAREKNVPKHDRYVFVKGDISDGYLILSLCNRYNIRWVVHFAAYSHVDNSFDNSIEFTKNNVLGTHILLEACKTWGKLISFIHISTDEVYGQVVDGVVNEDSILSPTNPYAASKAAAEMLVQSYIKSYKFPAIITRSNNVYGPRQYPEKVIPKFILQSLRDLDLTIHGKGESIRDFIYVDDVVDALILILEAGDIGEIYNIGEASPIKIKDLADKIIDICRGGKIKYVEDRLFNDQRYRIDATKLAGLGWCTKFEFEEGLLQTVEWYKNNINYFE